MNDTLLRRTLRLNTWVSAAWGVTAVLGAPWLNSALGTPTVPTAVVGVITLVAAWSFHSFGRRPELRSSEGAVAAVGDLAFGVALAVVAIALQDLTVLGRWIVGASGLAVVGFGLLEAEGTRRLATGSVAREA